MNLPRVGASLVSVKRSHLAIPAMILYSYILALQQHNREQGMVRLLQKINNIKLILSHGYRISRV